MRLKILTAPTVEPITLTDAKLWLKQDSAADDTLITSLIKEARRWTESYTRRALLTQTWRAVLDRFPRTLNAGTDPRLRLPGGQCLSVEVLSYVDGDGNTQTPRDQTVSPKVDGTFQIDLTPDDGGLVLPAWGESWPDIRQTLVPVIVEFTVGYGAASTDIPEDLLSAFKYKMADLYELRSSVDFFNAKGRWTPVAQSYAGPYQINWFGALDRLFQE
jgi:uncharacterized phiE125 gp8 family phage protein